MAASPPFVHQERERRLHIPSRPVGQITLVRPGLSAPCCQVLRAKIFYFPEYSDYPILLPAPPHQKGRIMIVANAGRDAVDAEGAFDEWRRKRTAKTCGPGTPTLVSSSR